VAAADLFLLDPDLVHLNHGSFGACPQPVFDVYQEWQRELERRPVEFLARRLEGELAEVRAAIAGYVGASADDIALTPHATAALNGVVRSLRLAPGDEILTTEHEYGSIELLLQFVSERTGALVVRREGTDADSIWAGATERTRVLLVSHITSPTALLMPVEELCRRACEAGVVSVVDGAHGPGHVELDLERLGADFYAGNCHKWLCAPKGAGFLYARRPSQELVDPLLISWSYRPDGTFGERHGWQGTHDPAAYLAVPAAIDFVNRHGRTEECRALLRQARGELASAGFEPLAPESAPQMAACRLPECEPTEVQRRLREEFAIEALVRSWNGRPLARVSVAPYNTDEELRQLVAALGRLL
jgi:isopenicillin-N epimerase